MLVFDRIPLVLLAVPKTGTTALHRAFSAKASIVIRRPSALKHTSMRRFSDHLAPAFGLDETLEWRHAAVVREPISWLQSWYRYRNRDQIAGQLRSTKGMTFEDFALAYMLPRKPNCAQIGNQSTILSNPLGPAGISDLFAYERMDQLVELLEGAIGKRVKLNRVNISPVMEDADLALSAPTKSKLFKKLEEDYAFYEDALRRT